MSIELQIVLQEFCENWQNVDMVVRKTDKFSRILFVRQEISTSVNSD